MGINFFKLWISQLLSQISLNILNFLLLARIYEVTGSTIATTFLWVSYAVPVILFGPIGAGFVDMVSRRKTLKWANFLQSATVLFYVLTYEYSLILLFAVVMIYSLLNQFYVPAEAATLPSVVKKKQLPTANSIFFITQQASIILGFGFAGILQKFFGLEGVLILSSTFLFLAFVSVSLLPTLSARKIFARSWKDMVVTFLNHVIEGYKFIKNHKYVLYPLALLFLIQVGLAIVIANLPIVGKEILMVSVDFVGVLIVVPAGIGAIVGSVFIGRLLRHGFRKIKAINVGLASLGIPVLLIAWAIPYFSETFRFITSPLTILLVGFGFVAINIPTVTYLQEVTPAWLRGRVFGNLFFLITLVTILPIIFSGVISEYFGVKILLTILAIGVILVLTFSLIKGQKLIEENFKNHG